MTQPRSSKTRRLESTIFRISGSKGIPPRPFHHATRTPLNERLSGARNRAPSSWIESGLRASGPAIVLRNSATSATERAIGPDTASADHDPDSLGTRPGEGRMPTTLQKAAGLRSDPPVSLPSAIGTMPHASATAAPPLLPPQVLVRSYGFRVAPKTVLNVCEPAPNSGVLVFPSVIAPADRMRDTMRA